MTLISIGNAGVEFGATEIFRDVSMTIAPGDRWAVVGRNGTGKTTLVRLITGDVQPTKGTVARTPGLKVALMDQHRRFPESMPLWDIVADGFGDLRLLEHSLAEQAKQLESDHSDAAMAKYGRDLERFQHEGGYEMSARVDAMLQGMGFDPALARVTTIGTLSGGERGRVALARQLATPADVLILDEPTNHLDLETTAWLERHLAESERTILCISHDRAFLNAFADHVLHFEGGTAFFYTGGYQSFVQQREEKRLTQQRQFDKQQAKISAEMDYIARNLAGQNTRQAKGRRTLLARMPRLSSPIGADGVMSLKLDAGSRSGDRVIEAKDVTVGVQTPAGIRELLRDVTVVLERGEVVALLGPNGAGKSTLIKTLLGEHPAISGDVRVGQSTTVAYYRQDLAHLPMDKTIYDAIADERPLWERRQVQGHLGRYGYSGDEVQRTIGTLSGGERARVAMALLTLSTNNLLIMDEPTNHLDVESIEALEDAVDEFEGSALIVSHDRAVLRALATQVWEVRNQQLQIFSGSFVEWETMRAERQQQETEEARTEAQREAARVARDREKQRVREDEERKRSGSSKPMSTADSRKQLRVAEKAVADAELRVSTLESSITALTEKLDDPSLYDTPAGVQKATQWGKQLDEEREQLDEAMHAWSMAEEQLASLKS